MVSVKYMNWNYIRNKFDYENPTTRLIHEFSERQCVYFCGQVGFYKKTLTTFQKFEFKIWNKIEKTTRDFLYKFPKNKV